MQLPRGITRNVFALGLVSLCTDLASEMIYPIIPLFVVGTLGATPAALGLIEGIAEGISTGLRWIGGVLSDRTRRRKPFVVAGYSLSAVSKPLMGLAAFALGVPLFLAGRASDRLGKSLRTAARDALIADSTAAEFRGRAFGFHRAMDTCGAIVGPLIALLVITCWSHVSLAWLFFVALIPGTLSVVLAAGAVREIRPASPQVARVGTASHAAPYPRAFWHLLLALGVFSLGNSSDALLLLRASNLGFSFAQVIVAFALFNTVYAATAAPLGSLSDRVGRKPVLLVGWVVYALVYLGFAGWTSTRAPWLLLGLYGLYHALTEGVTKALVSDLVPPERRAGAIGLLATVAGLGQLVASILAGVLWDTQVFGQALHAGLALGALAALVALPILATLKLEGRRVVERAAAQ